MAQASGSSPGIELAGREFEHRAPHRIAELPLEHHAAVVEQRHDHHRARMDDVFARRAVAIGQAHGVALGMQEACP